MRSLTVLSPLGARLSRAEIAPASSSARALPRNEDHGAVGCLGEGPAGAHTLSPARNGLGIEAGSVCCIAHGSLGGLQRRVRAWPTAPNQKILRSPPDSAQATADTAHVFISYASPDGGIASALVEHLERQGIPCWIAPRNVDAGALYADAIVRAIGGAKAFVLVLSESAIASAHVGKEVERASSKNVPSLQCDRWRAPDPRARILPQ